MYSACLNNTSVQLLSWRQSGSEFHADGPAYKKLLSHRQFWTWYIRLSSHCWTQTTSSDSCNSRCGWRRTNVWVSMALPSRVSIINVTADVGGKTSSTDDGCVLFQTQIGCECHCEIACTTRSIDHFGSLPVSLLRLCLVPVHNSSVLSWFNFKWFANIQWPISCMHLSNTSHDVSMFLNTQCVQSCVIGKSIKRHIMLSCQGCKISHVQRKQKWT